MSEVLPLPPPTLGMRLVLSELFSEPPELTLPDPMGVHIPIEEVLRI